MPFVPSTALQLFSRKVAESLNATDEEPKRERYGSYKKGEYMRARKALMTYRDSLDHGAINALNRQIHRVLDGERQLRELPQTVRPSSCTCIVTRKEPTRALGRRKV